MRAGRNRTTPPRTRSGPTDPGHPGAPHCGRPHRFTPTPPRPSAPLRQEGHVDEFTGRDLGDLAGNHDETIRLGQRRQQMRGPSGRLADGLDQVVAAALITQQLAPQESRALPPR